MAEERLRAIDKAIDLLSLLDRPESTITVEAAQEALGVPRSTLYRLISSLVARRLLRQLDTGIYALGPWFQHRLKFDLFSPAMKAAIAPILRQVMEETGETALIGIRSGINVIYVDRAETSHALKAMSDLNKPFPLHAGATGKAILAFLPDEEAREIVGKGKVLTGVGPRTIRDPAAIMAQIADIRERGYASSSEEVYPGCAGVSIPLLDGVGVPLASLSIEAPIERFPPSKIEGAVKILRSYESKLVNVLSQSL